GAARVVAIRVPQMAHNQSSLAELRPNPWRHDGIPTCDHDPGQGVGQGPSELRIAKAAQRLLDALFACAPGQQARDRFSRSRIVGLLSASDLAKNRVKSAWVLHPRCEKMKGGDRVRLVSILRD